MYTRPGTTDVKSTMLLDAAQNVGEPSSIDENVAPRARLAVYIRLRKFTRRREERVSVGNCRSFVTSAPGGRGWDSVDSIAPQIRTEWVHSRGRRQIRENVYDFDHD